MKKQDSEKMRFLWRCLRGTEFLKEGAYGAPFLFGRKEDSGSSCNFYKTIAWRKSSSNVRNSGIFAAFIYGDTQKASKPKPDIFWNAAKAIGRDPKECLVVEDSTPGVMAGIAAGGETIYIHDMVDVPEEVLEHASASLEDLGQIIEWMENVK